MDELESAGPRTVLVADDNAANLALARDVLQAAGYRVLVARDGESALRSLEAERPDLVLLDVHMPRGDGYATCARIKEDPDLVDLPVLFLSGMDEVFNKVQALRLGAVDYIVKPFQAAELVARVSTHLELARSRDRIRRYAERLERTLSELRETERKLADSEKQAALGTLSSGLAHELNNPINFIALGTEALSRDFAELLASLAPGEPGALPPSRISQAALVEEIPRLLEGVRLGAERSARIVKSLETFSNPEREEEAWADLAALLDEALALAGRRRIPPPRVELAFKLKPRILCYPRKLTQLLYALVDNAFAAAVSSADPCVSIELEARETPSGPFVSILVADSGPGVPTEIRDRIFDPFFTTRVVGEGAGLGLTIARGIAAEHGGELELLPDPAQGSRFRLTLPYRLAR